MTQGSSIGRSVRRLDGGEKVTGLTRYAGDLQLSRMLHARLVLSPHAHARIVQDRRERGRGPARGSGSLRRRRSRSRQRRSDGAEQVPARARPRDVRGASGRGRRRGDGGDRRGRGRARRGRVRASPGGSRRAGRHATRRPSRAGRGGRRRGGGAGDARGGDRRGAAPRGGRAQRGEHAAVPPGGPRPRLRRGRRGDRAPLRDSHGPPGLPRAARRGGRRRPARHPHHLDRDPGALLHAVGGVRGTRASGAPGARRGDAARRRLRREVRAPGVPGRRARAPAPAAGLRRHDADRGVPLDDAGAARRDRGEAGSPSRRDAHRPRGPGGVRRRRLRRARRSGSRS